MAQMKVYATGKRKTAVARVYLKSGSGRITINGREWPANTRNLAAAMV